MKIAVHDGYGFIQDGRKLGAIRIGLMSNVTSCPICGISVPRELDHYLPRSVYKPLAIYVRNLVPLCHECNHSKGAAEADHPARQFVHPYFHELPDVQFLRATVVLQNSALYVNFDVDPAIELPDLLRARLSFQLERLRLNDRYQREINAYLTSHTIALGWCFEAAASSGVRTFLQRQANVERAFFHRNHWRPILLGALADHASFCDGGFQDVLPI